MVDDILLAERAEREGVTVTEDEISLMIRSGITDPIADGRLAPDEVKVMEETLEAAGTTLEDAPNFPPLRAAMKRFLLIQRHARATGESRDVRLVRAQADANIQLFPERLKEPR